MPKSQPYMVRNISNKILTHEKTDGATLDRAKKAVKKCICRNSNVSYLVL